MSGKSLSVALNDIPDDMILSAMNAYKQQKIVKWVWFQIGCAVVAAALLALFLLSSSLNEFVTAPGVIKIMAYDMSDGPGNNMVGQRLEEGLELEKNSGWGAGEGFLTHIPLSFSLEDTQLDAEEITFEVTVGDGRCMLYESDIVEQFGLLYCEENGIEVWHELGKKFTVTNGQTIYWDGCDPDGPFTAEKTFVDVVIKADEYIVGYAVVMIGRGEFPVYTPSLLKAEYYPLVDGGFQDVTEEYVKRKIAECKE